MTCRFELEFQGKAYPRSCPTCGLAGSCVKGYGQLKYAEGGYSIVDSLGRTADQAAKAKADTTRPHGVAAFAPLKISRDTLDGVKEAERMGYTNDKPVRVIETKRRLHLIGFLAELPPIDKYNVIQLDELVDKIAAILLD